MRCIPTAATRVLIVVICCLMYALVYYQRIWPAILSEDLAGSMNISDSQMGSFGSMYFFPYAFIQPVAGLLADVIDPAYLLAISSATFSLGSLGIAFSRNYLSFCISRAIIGLGCGPVVVPASRVLANWFSPRGFYFLYGLMLMFGAAGGIVAQGPLASIIKHIPWRITFYYLTGIGAFLSVSSFVFIEGKPPAESKRLTSEEPLLSSMSDESDSGAYGKWQTLKNNSKRILSNKHFWWLVLWDICIPGAMFYPYTSLWSGIQLKQVFGFSKEKAGNSLSLLNIAFVAGTPLLSFISEYFHTRKWIVFGTSILAFAVSFTFIFFKPTDSYIVLLILIFLLGLACVGPASTASAMFKELEAPEMAGAALGCSNLFPFVSTSIFSSLVSLMLKKFDPASVGGKVSFEGFRDAFWIPTTILSAVGVVGALFSKETYPLQKSESHNNT